MARGLKDGEQNGREVYSDIIDHPHWQSPVRPHMSLYNRAAQFSAFDALAGYTDMVKEEQRPVDRHPEPDETHLEILNQKLALIADAIAGGHKPTMTITYFIPDEVKDGGKYESVTAEIKKIDPVLRKIMLTKNEGYGRMNYTIDMDTVLNIQGELVDALDETVW